MRLTRFLRIPSRSAICTTPTAPTILAKAGIHERNPATYVGLRDDAAKSRHDRCTSRHRCVKHPIRNGWTGWGRPWGQPLSLRTAKRHESNVNSSGAKKGVPPPAGPYQKNEVSTDPRSPTTGTKPRGSPPAVRGGGLTAAWARIAAWQTMRSTSGSGRGASPAASLERRQNVSGQLGGIDGCCPPPLKSHKIWPGTSWAKFQ